MDHLGRLRTERLVQGGVQLLVGAVIRTADHMRDLVVHVVDDARQVEGRRAFVAPQHHAVETLRQPGRPRRFEMTLRAVALADGPIVPVDAEPAQVLEDRLLTPGQVAGGVGVVDAEQHPIAEPPVRDSAHRVADVQRPGRARGKTHAWHTVTLVCERAPCPERLPLFRDFGGRSRLPM